MPPREPSTVPTSRAAPAARRGSAWLHAPIFLARFLRSPRAVGAVAPSSRFLAQRMLQGIEWTEGVRIVELGPGTGPFTRAVLERLPASGRYLGIERDATFAAILRRRFPDARFHEGSAEDLVEVLSGAGIEAIDHVVSGLPFASLPVAVTRRILDAVVACLRGGGTFTTFQYLHAAALPAARIFRAEMTRRLGPSRRSRIEMRNLPPAFVLTWTKACAGDDGAAAGSP